MIKSKGADVVIGVDVCVGVMVGVAVCVGAGVRVGVGVGVAQGSVLVLHFPSNEHQAQTGLVLQPIPVEYEEQPLLTQVQSERQYSHEAHLLFVGESV